MALALVTASIAGTAGSAVVSERGQIGSYLHSRTAASASVTPRSETTAPCPPNSRLAGKGCVSAGAFVVHGERCRSARRGAVYYRARTWERQDARQGERSDRTPVVRGKSCRWARYAAKEHAARARSAARSLKRWQRERVLQDFRVREGSQAWLRAVLEAQKPYPGTRSWLLSCSAAEGGHGRWVPNSQGSGVGGWMQMYPSTFWRMFASAKQDVERKGYRVPASAASWYSPLGQALGSAWGLMHGRRHEWHGAGC